MRHKAGAVFAGQGAARGHNDIQPENMQAAHWQICYFGKFAEFGQMPEDAFKLGMGCLIEINTTYHIRIVENGLEACIGELLLNFIEIPHRGDNDESVGVLRAESFKGNNFISVK